jgi:hypothetical protein
MTEQSENAKSQIQMDGIPPNALAGADRVMR